MALSPNLYTHKSRGIDRGLHYYKGDAGPVLLRKQSCGDWQVIRFATEEEAAVFRKHGEPVVDSPVLKEFNNGAPVKTRRPGKSRNEASDNPG